MEADIARRLKDAFPQFSSNLIEEVYRFKGPRTVQYLAMLARQADENRPKSPSTPPSSHRDSTTFFGCDASQSTPSRTSEAPSEGSDEGGTSSVGKRDQQRQLSKDARLDVKNREKASQRLPDVNARVNIEKTTDDTQSSSSKGTDSSNSIPRMPGIKLDLSDLDESSSVQAVNALLDNLRSNGGADDVDSRLVHLNAQQLEEHSSITKSDENGKESIDRLLKLTSLERDFAMLQIEEGVDHRRLEEHSAVEVDCGEQQQQQVEAEVEADTFEIVEAEDDTRQKLCRRRSNSCDAQLTLPFEGVEELRDSNSRENSDRAPHCDSDHGGVPSDGGIPRMPLQNTQLDSEYLCPVTRVELSGDNSEDHIDDPDDLEASNAGDHVQEVDGDPSSADGAIEASLSVEQEGETTGAAVRQPIVENDPDMDYLVFLENSIRAHRIRCALGLTAGPSGNPSGSAQSQGLSQMSLPPGFESDDEGTSDPIATSSALTPHDSTAQADDAVAETGTSGERHDEGMPSVTPVLTQHADVRAMRWKSVQEMGMDRLKECLAEFEASTPKEEIKLVDRKIRMTVTQVAGSLRKVMDQSAQLLKILSQQKTLSSKVFCCSRLAGHIVTRCCGLNEVLAVAQAHVARNLIAEYPDLLKLIMFHLHQTSPLLVPMCWTYDPSSPAEREVYEKKMKYVRAGGAMTEQMQTMEQYLARHAGLVYFHAGLIAVASERDSYGAEAGWTYLARFLNEIPPDQTTIPFLFYFLKIAGHSLHSKFKNQFLKLLRFVERKFVEGESLKDDPYVLPAVSRLRTYISSQAYLQVPESLTMPETEASLTIHA